MEVSPQLNSARLVKSGPTGSLSGCSLLYQKSASDTGLDFEVPERLVISALVCSVTVLELC